MVGLDKTSRANQQPLSILLSLFFINQEIRKVSDAIQWEPDTYKDMIKSIWTTGYGINDSKMDINTSEAEIWRHFTSMIKDDDLLISQSIDAFRVYDTVSEIYYSNKGDLVKFFVLLDNEEYDFDLMDELFTVERYLYQIWDGKFLDFHYAPINDVNRCTLFDYHIAYKKG